MNKKTIFIIKISIGAVSVVLISFLIYFAVGEFATFKIFREYVAANQDPSDIRIRNIYLLRLFIHTLSPLVIIALNALLWLPQFFNLPTSEERAAKRADRLEKRKALKKEKLKEKLEKLK